MTSSGKLTTLYNFCSQTNCVDCLSPYGGLIEGTDGNFYGTTTGGGTSNDGSVLRVKSAGLLTTLASINSVGFAGTGVIEGGTDGNFYGTTSNGGPPGPHLFLRANHAFGQAVLRNPDQPIMR